MIQNLYQSIVISNDMKKLCPSRTTFAFFGFLIYIFSEPLNTIKYNEELEYKRLKNIIYSANNPDLIVMTGDTFEETSENQVETFVNFLDSFKIPWTFTYGNHDLSSKIQDNYYINEQIINAKYSIYIDYKDDSIYGLTNFYINLTEYNKTRYRLYLIDSNALKKIDIKGDSIWDVIHNDQLNHIAGIASSNKSAPGLAFIHIPLREYIQAYDGYRSDPQKYLGSGDKLEPITAGYKENGTFDTFVNVGIIGCFCGYDHKNDFDIDYYEGKNKMLLSFGLKSTHLNYYSELKLGYKIITLPSDANNFNHTCIEKFYIGY